VYEVPSCLLTSINERDSTSRKLSFLTKALMNPVLCFINTDDQTFGSSAASIFQKFG